MGRGFLWGGEEEEERGRDLMRKERERERVFFVCGDEKREKEN